MSRPIRRRARAFAAALLVGAVVALAAPAASADPKIPFTQDVYARTHLARSGMDLTVPPGVFEGTIDLATGEQTGTLTLPPAAVTINLFGVFPTADASFAMEPAGPITGKVDLATFAVDTTASFNVKLARFTPHGTDLNLVGDGCTTVEPVLVRMQGVVNPATGGTFSSTYTIPDFENCRLLTPVITAFVSGPGNTFVASFAPHGAPPPTAPTEPAPAPASPPLATIDVQGSVTVSNQTLPIDQHLAIPPQGQSPPPLLTATPAPAPTTTAAPPPAPPPGGLLGSLLRPLLGG